MVLVLRLLPLCWRCDFLLFSRGWLPLLPPPPTFPHPADLDESELLLWALQCIVDLASAMASLVDDEFGTSDTTLVVPRSVESLFFYAVIYFVGFFSFLFFFSGNPRVWPLAYSGASLCDISVPALVAPLSFVPRKEEAQAGPQSDVTVSYFIICRVALSHV